MQKEPDFQKFGIKKEDVVPRTNKSGDVIGYSVVVGKLRIPFDLVEYGLTPDPKRDLPRLLDMEVFEDDVFICTIPKSGTHWMAEIVPMIVNKSTTHTPTSIYSNGLEFHKPEEFDAFPRPRVLNTHLPVHGLPRQILEKRCKVLWMQRNPKDRVVSLYNHYKSATVAKSPPWEDILYLDMSGQSLFVAWYDYIREFEDILDETSDHTLPLFFEDMKKNPVQEVKKIAKFLGKECSDEFAEEVAEKCNFKNLKGTETSQSKFGTIFRKGEIGDWKNYFTVAQNEEYNALIADKIAKFAI